MCICEGVVLRHKQRYLLVLREVKGRRVHVVVLVQVCVKVGERGKATGIQDTLTYMPTRAHTRCITSKLAGGVVAWKLAVVQPRETAWVWMRMARMVLSLCSIFALAAMVKSGMSQRAFGSAPGHD